MTRQNKLYYGDNLEILRKYIKDESIDLCYIDPPFNSKRNYNQIYNNTGKEDRAQSQAFIDTWEWDTAAENGLAELLANAKNLYTEQIIHLIMGLNRILGKSSLFAYLVSMTLRIAEIHRVLKKTGSFYLHCDPTASHYLKLILDAVFCSQGGDFQNEIVWCYTSPTNVTLRFPRKHDVIFFYTKGNPEKMNYDAIRVPYSEESLARANRNVIKKGGTIYDHVELNAKGKIPEDWWADIVPASRKPGERLGYPTQKPEGLLERIIKASSNEGDIVLDAYCGCGTTVAVSQKLNRKWIGIDITYQSIALILKRLEDSYGKGVLENIETNGVPIDIESATALATKADDRTRKEFEKWAILTYSSNRAIIHEKKGKDFGIDGITYILEKDNQHKEILFSVKSGKVNSAHIRDLRGVIEREKAAAGIFISLQPPTKDMQKEAAMAGVYQNEYMGKPLEKIKIVTVEQILSGERLALPATMEVFKKAQTATRSADQQGLF